MNPQKNRAFVDADIYNWCTKERIAKFKEDYLSFVNLFARSKASIAEFNKSWIVDVHLSYLLEKDSDDYLLDTSSTDTLIEDWSNSCEPNLLNLLSEQQILRFAVSDTLMLKWAELQWFNRLESLYLERKGELDQVSFSLIRTKNAHLATELYYRLKSDNIPFEQLSWQFGEGPERNNAGFFPLTRVSNLPEGVPMLLSKLNIGNILKPNRVGKWYVIIKLHHSKEACFDNETKKYLLKSELEAWVDAISRSLRASIECP